MPEKLRINYHVFEPGEYSERHGKHTCAVCGNTERGATGTGHVDTEGHAYRLNLAQLSD